MNGPAERLRRRPLQVLVMAKAPVAGRVKTRLCPPLSHREAAAVAKAALADTLESVLACQADFKVLALAGEPGPWLPSGLEVIAQRGHGLAERLANAWADSRPLTAGWGLQLGMDTPQVTPAELDGLLDDLVRPAAPARAVLGPALDGGWWIIGLPGTDPAGVFRGLPMSTPGTGRAQQRRLQQLGLDVVMARSRCDIDTIEDLRAVARQIPRSATAAVAREVLTPYRRAVSRARVA